MTARPENPETALENFFAALPVQGGPAPEAVAQAFAVHLASLDVRQLPPAARLAWDGIVMRLLKVPAATVPIPGQAIGRIASWPSARITELISALRSIAVDAGRAANDRLADETNARISRAYL